MFQSMFGAALAVLYAAFWAWHSPRQGKLTKAEVNHYMTSLEELPAPPGEANPNIARFRRWAEADDGKPVYMFNLIRYFPELRTFPGAPHFEGTPRESNTHYTKRVARLWLSHAAYPMFDGNTQSENLLTMQPERTWDQVTLVRYRNRRTFLSLLSDPSYAPSEPYKFMAMELDLVPVSGDTVVPDARWMVGGACVIVFLLAGWARAARRRDELRCD
jgi:hypothetical protein